MTLETRAIAGREHEAMLDEFYAGLYLAEFASQREPLEVWKRRLWSGEPAPYALCIRLAGEHLDDPARRVLAGGIAYEYYPRSNVGLVTYMVVAPAARRAGVGKALIAGAVAVLHERGARWVFGEVIDPRRAADADRASAWRRLERNQRWGARVVDATYVQPALGPGLARDRGLCLIALAPPGDAALPATIPGAIVGDFVRELFAITEGVDAVDAELAALLAALPAAAALVQLRREWYP